MANYSRSLHYQVWILCSSTGGRVIATFVILRAFKSTLLCKENLFYITKYFARREFLSIPLESVFYKPSPNENIRG